MKQTALFLSLLMIVFSSCKKEDVDGVYDPKKRLTGYTKKTSMARNISLNSGTGTRNS